MSKRANKVLGSTLEARQPRTVPRGQMLGHHTHTHTHRETKAPDLTAPGVPRTCPAAPPSSGAQLPSATNKGVSDAKHGTCLRTGVCIQLPDSQPLTGLLPSLGPAPETALSLAPAPQARWKGVFRRKALGGEVSPGPFCSGSVLLRKSTDPLQSSPGGSAGMASQSPGSTELPYQCLLPLPGSPPRPPLICRNSLWGTRGSR